MSDVRPAIPLVSVLIVNYRVGKAVAAAVEAVKQTSHTPYEIIVVDNDSHDWSVEHLAMAHPDIGIVPLPRNIGFGRANNAGLQHCRGQFIFLLNPDVVVDPGCLDRLADVLLVRPDVAAVGANLRRPDGRPDLAARRGFPTVASAFFRLSGLSRLFPRSRWFNRYNLGHLSVDQPSEIDTGTAACLMVRRTAIDQVGFFDPDYFMYGEDIDLCYRLKQKGWRILYEPAATALHVKGESSRQATRRMLYHFHDSMWIFHRKHYLRRHLAFTNGLVWLAIWTRWLVLTVAATLRRDPRVSA